MIGRKVLDNPIINIEFDINEKKTEHLFCVRLEKNKSLIKEFKDYIRLKNIKIESPYYLYLKRNDLLKNLIEMKNYQVQELKLAIK